MRRNITHFTTDHFTKRTRAGLLLSSAALLSLSIASAPAAAASFKVLHSFCIKSNCADGSAPFSPLFSDAADNLYGTTKTGGAQGSGTVYRLTPNSDKSKWAYSVLYSFCSAANCIDGKSPTAGGLVVDVNGNLYGTTSLSDRRGTAFKLSPGSGSSWTLTTLHDFCNAQGGRCVDGDTPGGALSYRGASYGAPYDGNSLLFGLTNAGGERGKGAVFTLKPSASGWKEETVFSFCADVNCHGGGSPGGSLVVATDDFLYGAAPRLGQYGGGSIFQLLRGHTSWSQTRLHDFCSQTNCVDGDQPSIGFLERDSQDNLYGTTIRGGANGQGVAFKLVPSAQTLTVLHNFCSKDGCQDGKLANGGLQMASTATFYGTLSGGGAHDAGMVYKLSNGALQVLHKFCSEENCSDGSRPFANVIPDASGALYGTTTVGGRGAQGVVYQLTP